MFTITRTARKKVLERTNTTPKKLLILLAQETYVTLGEVGGRRYLLLYEPITDTGIIAVCRAHVDVVISVLKEGGEVLDDIPLPTAQTIQKIKAAYFAQLDLRTALMHTDPQ